MSRQLTAHIARYRSNLLSVVQHSCATLSSAVHDGTPIDTGAARRSWQITIGGVERPRQGSDFLSIARRMKLGNEYRMHSSIHYIRKLEYGHSRQAPSGMLRINVARWPQIVERSVSLVR